MNRPRLLDLFCGAGGCSVGYHRAGFDVTGVDIEPHDDYPYELIVADAMTVVMDTSFLAGFDVVHASPPCQRWSLATAAHTRASHPDLIEPIRHALDSWGGLYAIENVMQAPLLYPVILCGSSFDLRVRRHRMFESNAFLFGAECRHATGSTVGVYGDHPDRPGGWTRPDGTSRGVKATSVADAQDALGIDWMTRWDDLADAIPPAYTEHVGAQLIDHLRRVAA